MYNGIGLDTVRGSGTNGYVQRNLSQVRRHKDKVDYKSEDQIQKLEATLNKKPNLEILQHERKRKIELKCVELEELMEEQGYTTAEIDEKVSRFRRTLEEKEAAVVESERGAVEYDQYGRPIATATHQLAAAQQEKNDKLKEAFGLSTYVEGAAFDPERRKRMEEMKKAKDMQKVTKTVESDSEEPPKKKKKKHKHKQSRDSSGSPSPEKEKKRKKKSKKHKRDSISADTSERKGTSASLAEQLEAVSTCLNKEDAEAAARKDNEEDSDRENRSPNHHSRHQKRRHRHHKHHRKHRHPRRHHRSRRHHKRHGRRKNRSRSRSKSRERSKSHEDSSSAEHAPRPEDPKQDDQDPTKRMVAKSIRKRRGSPSHLERRRITSARKRPIPYYRPSPPTPSSCSTCRGSRSRSRTLTPSPLRRMHNRSPYRKRK